jgi:hypothetical protein
MNYTNETFEDRVVRLLGASLKSPEKTREILTRLSSETREQLQPSDQRERSSAGAGQLQQAELL